jgi:filamentous hemagglutinin
MSKQEIFSAQLAGNGPLLIDKDTGELHILGTARAPREYLDEYFFSDPTPDETEAQRDAEANVVSSLVAGIAGMADPSAAATAIVAATANVDNNWLATQQKIQFDNDYVEAKTATDKFAVLARWNAIGIKQDVLTTAGLSKGVGEGLADIGLSTLDGATQAIGHPDETIATIKDLYESGLLDNVLGTAKA